MKKERKTMSNAPMSCIEQSCAKFGIRFFNGSNMCPSCGGQMYLVEEHPIGFTDDPDEEEFSNDMLQRLSATSFMDRPRILGPTVVSHSDVFRCSPDVKGCPIAPKAKVFVDIDMFNKWIFLAGRFDTEWIAYLKGHEKEGEENTFVITEMYFPKQKASGAHVDAEDGQIQEGTIAAVHSHVAMNVFWSGEDEAHFNHTIEFVVNRRGEIKAMARTKLECGRFHRGDADVFFSGCEEALALEEQLESNLTEEKTFTTVTASSSSTKKNGFQKQEALQKQEHQQTLPIS